jgi:hypothetical protein
MTIRYETVKYGVGAVGDVRPDNNVIGFADPAYYDTIPSSITRPGSNATVLGQGGLIDAGLGIAQDLASGGVAGLIGAAQKALSAYDTYKDKDLASIARTEVRTSAKTIGKGALPAVQRAVIGTAGQRGTLDGIFFPTPPKGDTRAPARNLNEVAQQILRQGTSTR